MSSIRTKGQVKSKDGVQIYAEASGDSSKPPVVFIHGIGLSAVVWDAQFSDPELMGKIYAVGRQNLSETLPYKYI